MVKFFSEEEVDFQKSRDELQCLLGELKNPREGPEAETHSYWDINIDHYFAFVLED